MGAGTIISDLTTGIYTAYAILAAVIQREATGHGQYIDIAMVDCMVSLLHTYVANYSANGVIPPRHGNRDLISAPADCYKAKDGYVVMHAGEDKAYELLKKVIGDERLEDPKFDSHQGRVDHQEECESYIHEWFASRTAEQAEHELLKGGVMATTVNDMPRLFASEQLKARQSLVEIEVPYGGTCVFQGSPIKMSEAPVTYNRAPEIGEHNTQVLEDILHKTAEEINDLAKRGII